MTDLQVMISIISVYGAVLGYVALTSIQQQKKLATMDVRLTNIENSVEKTSNVTDGKIDKLSERLDLFLKKEIDLLQDLVKK